MHNWKNKSLDLLVQGINEVRALNFSNSGEYKVGGEMFTKIPNLHFLVLDGCDMSRNLKNISKELWLLQWRYVPSNTPFY